MNQNLSGIQFRYTGVAETGGKTKVHQMEAVHPEHGLVGALDWTAREVRNISVPPDHRRQGIATQLWHEASRIADGRTIPAPKHSPQRTKDGDAWARSVGGRLPRRDTR